MRRRDFNALVGGAAVVRSAALAVAVLLFAVPLGVLRAASPVADAAQGDFARLVDIGDGRRLYLECRGTGSPVVVLEAGYRSSARIWSEDYKSGAPRMMVLAGVAAFTRVCAYDRPGTVAHLNNNVRQSRSDPLPMPRTAPAVVADLHALLHAAGVPGPYIFAGHSLGGFIVRLYASTYPRDVLGLVLVDAYSEMLETLLTPERWAALVRLNVRSGSDTVERIPSYGNVRPRLQQAGDLDNFMEEQRAPPRQRFQDEFVVRGEFPESRIRRWTRMRSCAFRKRSNRPRSSCGSTEAGGSTPCSNDRRAVTTTSISSLCSSSWRSSSPPFGSSDTTMPPDPHRRVWCWWIRSDIRSTSIP